MSRTRFRQIVEESGSVVRPHDNPDYGVDDSVELFAEDSPTGLIFFAQVKSSSRMSAKLKRSTIND